MSDLVARLKAACVGHPDAKIPWPHRLLHEAADELTSLRARVAKLEELLRRTAARATEGPQIKSEKLTQPVCGLCGKPMPPGEEMFQYHGYSGPCPQPPEGE